MIRSFLFVPANVARRVEKAFTLDADAVILDLEDSVAASDKAPSRDAVVAAYGRSRQCLLYVRVNAPSTQYCYADLVATVQKGVDGVVVPKIESAADLHAIDVTTPPLSVTPSASQRPEGSVKARVARAFPAAMEVSASFFCASVPASRRAGTAMPMVSK